MDSSSSENAGVGSIVGTVGGTPVDVGVDAGHLFNVKNLVALVTGGGTGIGFMIAKALAKNGAAKVYIAGRRLEVLRAAAASIGPNVIPIECDVTDKSSLQLAEAAIEQDVGYLNLLVANAGVGGPQTAPVTENMTIREFADQNLQHSFEDYAKTFTVNAIGVWFTTMTLLRLLDRGNQARNVTQSSQVIITSSIAAFNKRAPGGLAYGQSKAAVSHAAQQLAVVLPKWNIRVNSIAPGLFPSEMSEPIVSRFCGGGEGASTKAVPASMVPMGRLGDESDMAGTLLYLASRAGAYTNGAVVVVDGGRLGTFPATS